jgi:polar amino acid transport system substrate-binding protein
MSCKTGLEVSLKPLRQIIAAVILIVTLLAAGCTPKGPPLKVKISTAASYMPFEFIDVSKRQLSGFDIELMKAIAAAANLDVEFVNTGYDQVLTGVAQCQVDGAISAIPISDELKQQMLFSNSYYAFGQVVVVKKGNSTITSLDSLSGKTVGVQKGTSSVDQAGRIPGIQLQTYPLYRTAFNALINGDIDAVITDKILALSYVNEAANNLKIAGSEFGFEDYGIAVCSQKADLQKRINDALASVKNNGSLGKLIQKWLANPVIE